MSAAWKNATRFAKWASADLSVREILISGAGRGVVLPAVIIDGALLRLLNPLIAPAARRGFLRRLVEFRAKEPQLNGEKMKKRLEVMIRRVQRDHGVYLSISVYLSIYLYI